MSNFTLGLATPELLHTERIQASRQWVAGQRANTVAVNVSPDTIAEMKAVLNGAQNSVQVLPAATYKRWGMEALAAWGNQMGVFSVPTWELANWLTTRHAPHTIHEVGCGNGRLAKHIGAFCSDGRLNQIPDLYAKRIGTRHAETPREVKTMTANQVSKVFAPPVILAQWVTPGNMNGYIDDTGRNAYGPNYSEILANCQELIFIGNRHTHDKSLAIELPPPDEELCPDWLLSRSMHPDANFIRIWKGGRA